MKYFESQLENYFEWEMKVYIIAFMIFCITLIFNRLKGKELKTQEWMFVYICCRQLGMALRGWTLRPLREYRY